MTYPTIHITMPDWAQAEFDLLPAFLPDIETRMAAVIHFSRRNFEEGTGGPFAAGVFERDTGRLITIGVNRVVPLSCSSAHAEVVTLALAQKQLGVFDLGGPELPVYQLVVNWRPCAMCFGALLWSGIRDLVIAGSDSALETITGFDEGPIHPEWQRELLARGITVRDNVLRDQALTVFRAFRDSGALVYNARQGAG